MIVLDGQQTLARISIARLIDVLEQAFRTGGHVQSRTIQSISKGDKERLLLSMPAFASNGAGVVKLVTVTPDNPHHGLPAIQGVVLVFSEAGTPIAVLDGAVVTRLRTGAASALASKYLSRPDSAHLAIVGTGALAPYMAMAHCVTRQIRCVSVYGRRPERALATAMRIRELVGSHVDVVTSDQIEPIVTAADIVSCSTSSASPVIEGNWLQPGVFVDLVGSFSPNKREADDETIRRSRIFVDTFEGALGEAGDILDPLARGVINRDHIKGELADLVHGRIAGRSSSDEITLFKSVGTALEDLAAAQLVVATYGRNVSSQGL